MILDICSGFILVIKLSIFNGCPVCFASLRMRIQGTGKMISLLVTV